MSTAPKELQRVRYYEAAQAYLRSLPLEHFMEATRQGTQRKASLASLSLVEARRRDFHLFNELLVQYRRTKRSRKIEQVVPDNMVVLYEGELDPEGSYDVELEPARPFWMLEYVSKWNKRKDYEDNHVRYETELKVPYYLLFYPDNEELSLFRHRRGRYSSVLPNAHGRLALPEVELEVALHGGWVRYWYQGVLLPLPAELQEELDLVRQQLAAATQRADTEKQRADTEKQRADAAIRRAAEEQRRADELARQLAELQAQVGKRPRRPENGR
jgi:Uma2 family endonuclease